MTLDKLQITAFNILRKKALTLFLLGLFPFATGLRVRNGALVPYTNWYALVGIAVMLPALYLSIVLIVAILQDAADAKRERAGSMVFSGAIGWQLLLLFVVIFLVGLEIGIYRQNGQVTAVEVAFALGMGLLAFYCWPRTIEFSGGALQQRKMFGGVKSISFPDILAAKFDAQQKCIIISGKNGVTIVHSMFHASQIQFARQLALLTGAHVLGLTV